MFASLRGRLPGSGVPASGDLANVHADGGEGFSGMVPGGAPIQTAPDEAGRHDDTGRHLVLTNPQHGSDLAPIVATETRPMLGGLRTSHHEGLMTDAPLFDGGHVELVNRVSVVVLAPVEGMVPDAAPALPSLRVPPPSDPYGRMCNNAAAAKEARR